MDSEAGLCAPRMEHDARCRGAFAVFEEVGPSRMTSPRLVAFAMEVQRGVDPTNAARNAGYAETTAVGKAGQLVRDARAAGLLVSEEAVRDVAAEVTAIFRDEAPAVARALVREAKRGDVGAAKEVLARVIGPVVQKFAPTNPAGDEPYQPMTPDELVKRLNALVADADG